MREHTDLHSTSIREQQRLINQAAQLSALQESNRGMKPAEFPPG